MLKCVNLNYKKMNFELLSGGTTKRKYLEMTRSYRYKMSYVYIVYVYIDKYFDYVSI